MKTVSGKFKGKVQERRIKDYVKRLLKSDFFLRNSENSLNIILLDISSPTYRQENIYESVGMRSTAMSHAMRYVVEGLTWA